MTNMTIGIVLPYLKSRGTEKQALRLARGFVKRGAEVVLFVVQGWGLQSMYRAFEEAGVEVVDVGSPLDKGKKSVSLNRLFKLAHLVHKYRCTVLLSRAGMTNKIAGLAGRLAFVPTVAVLSGAVKNKQFSTNPLKGWLSSLRAATSLGFPWRIVSVSREGAENFIYSNPLLTKRVIAIPNGIDMPEVGKFSVDLALDANKFYFCYSGSLEIERKGLDLLLGALGLVVKEYGYDQVTLLLIGAGEDEGQIKAMVEAEKLSGCVLFAGEQSEPFALMTKCQAFVLPSRKEGFPNALLEAMALGLCVIATDCDTGPREIITHEKDGLLVHLEDKKRLAEVMARVYRDHGLRQALAQQAKKTVQEKFSCEKMIDTYFTLLSRV